MVDITNIYALIHPLTGVPRYIGKANNAAKRLIKHINDNSISHKVNWIKSLKSNGLIPKLEIIDEVPTSEWQFWERHYISLYKSWGFNLTNETFGGDGVDVVFLTEQQKKKIGLANKGRKHTINSRLNMSKAHIGQKAWNKDKIGYLSGRKKWIPTNQQKENISKALKGRISSRKGAKLSDETKLKLSLVHTGKKLSEEHKSKLKGRVSPRKGIKCSEELKKKLSESHKGIKFTDDHKRKISESLRKYYGR